MSGVPAPSLNNEIPVNTVPRVLLVGMRPVMACRRYRATVTVGCEKLWLPLGAEGVQNQ